MTPPGSVRPFLSLVPAILLAVALAGPDAHGQSTGPTAVAEARFDLDRDGALDSVRIESPAAITVTLGGKASAGQSAWKPFATSGLAVVGGEITIGSGPAYNGRLIIVATARFAPRPGAAVTSEEALIVSWRGGALETVWTGAVGTRGHDGEYRRSVAATPRGLLRYQSRPDVIRCDGETAYLFPERYDFRQKRFRSVYNPPRLRDTAPVLVARPVAPAGVNASDGLTPSLAFRAQAASVQAGAGHAGELVPPRELDDGDPVTAWREDLGGDGRGEFVTFTTTMPDARVAAIRIVPGDAASRELFRGANRLRRAGLLVGERAYWIEFPRDPALERDFARPYWAVLPEPIAASCVTVIIDRVYPGTRARSARTGDTALADVAVLTGLDLTPAGAEAELASRVATGGEPGRAAARILAGQRQRGVAALLAEARAPGRTPEQRARVRHVLARIVRRRAPARKSTAGVPATKSPSSDKPAGDPSGGPSNDRSDEIEPVVEQLTAGLAETAPSPGDQAIVIDALVALGDPSVTALSALLIDDQESPSARQRAARALSRIPGDRARDALIAACGRGDRLTRKAVALALSRRRPIAPLALLEAAVQAEQQGELGAEADLWRAVASIARRAPANTRTTIGRAIAARLPTATGYELRYRLYSAAGTIASDEVIDALARSLTTLSHETPVQQARSQALLRIAARSIGATPVPRALALLIELAEHSDPGVRRQAIASLGQRNDPTDASDRAIITRLQGDSWPRLRRAAASALARRCGVSEPTSRALWSAIEDDDDIDVRRASLTALVDCRAPGIGQKLFLVARDREQPAKVRERAIALIAPLGDPSLARELVDLFASLRDEAWSSESAVRLAAAAAVAAGRLAGRGAVTTLLSAARDESFPEIQAAAVIGLGETCAEQALPLFDELVHSSQAGVAIAARGARDRCRDRPR